MDRGAHAPSRAGDRAPAIANFPGKHVLARRQNQHARRVRSPEIATAREDPPRQLERKHCAN